MSINVSPSSLRHTAFTLWAENSPPSRTRNERPAATRDRALPVISRVIPAIDFLI